MKTYNKRDERNDAMRNLLHYTLFGGIKASLPYNNDSIFTDIYNISQWKLT